MECPVDILKSKWSNMLFKACGFLLIFCLDYLSIDVTGVLKSITITVLLSISPFMFDNICFIYLDIPVLDVYMLTNI